MRDWGWKRAAHWVQSVIPQTKTRQWVKKYKSQKWLPEMLISSHLPLFCSHPLFITLFLPSCSRSVSFSGIACRWCQQRFHGTVPVHRPGSHFPYLWFTSEKRLMGDFPCQRREGSCDGDGDGGDGGAGGRVVVCTLGPDAVRDSNNGGTDRPAERCFYCKENLHDCIQALLLKCHHPPYTAHVWVSPSSFSAFLEIGARAFVPVSLQVCFCMYSMYWLCTM